MERRDRGRRSPLVDLPYRRLAEAGVVAAFLWNADGRIVAANDLLLQIVGRTREELEAGRVNWREMIAPEDRDRAERYLADLRESSARPPFELAFVRPDGTAAPVLTASTFLERSKEWGVSLLVDLSDRRRLEAERDQALRNLRLIAEASRLFTESLDRRELSHALVDLVVPQLADWAAVYLPDGDLLRRTSIRYADRSDFHTRFADRYPVPASSDAPVAVAARTGTVQHIRHVTEALIDDVATVAVDSAYRDALAQLGLQSGLVLPIAVGDELLAVLAVASTLDVDPYDAGPVLDTLHEIVNRAAVAFQRAKYAERDRDLARALQYAALPRRRPELAGHEFAACYVSSGEANLGGDWWDAVSFDDGRLALVVGDVVGHGTAAASVMAALRHSLRALLHSGLSPADALRSSNALALAEEPPLMASVVAVVYDPASRRVTCASAGHHAPLVVDRAAGTVSQIAGGSGPILGAIPDAAYTESMSSLPEGFELVLFTDGFTERRDPDEQVAVEDALRRALLDPPPTRNLQTRFERLVGEFSTGQDDACVLAMRHAERER